jgi:glycosyltransferase involved in cell wall biosynthesis
LMHLLVDVQALQSPATRERGIGRYARNIVTALTAARPGWQIELVQNEHLEPPQFGRAFPRLTVRRFLPPLPSELANSDANERYYADWLTAQGSDAILLLNCFDPITLAPMFQGWRPRLLAILYDLTQLVFHNHYLQGAREIATYGRRLRLVLASDRILALSRATAHDLELAAQGPSPPMEIIGGAADPAFVQLGAGDLRRYRQRAADELGLDRDFLLCAGGGDFRKNLPGMLRSFAALPEEHQRLFLLAIVGRLTPDQTSSLSELARQLGIAASLRVTGFVEDAMLRALFQLCRLVVFPSLHEGLGLPLLEALQCGAPVVASNCSAMPEYAGTVCRLADPSSPVAFARQIESALAEPRDAALAERLAHVGQFTWQRTAELACRAIEMSNKSACQPGRRRRVAWVSPLPPAPSGVADYSAELLPYLAQRYDIELVVDPFERLVSPEMVAKHTVLFGDEVSRRHEARPYDAFVFHVGNSHFHAYMLDLLRRFRGLLVLHETHLGGLIASLIRSGLWPNTLDQELAFEGQTQLSRSLRASVVSAEGVLESAPLNRRLLGLAGSVVVHSAWAWQRVRPLVSAPVSIIPQGVRPSPGGTKEADRKRLGLPAESFVVATLGLVRPAKRIPSIIRAAAELGRDASRKTRLLIVGHVEEDLKSELIRLSEDVGVASSVTFTGRVGMEDFVAYARAADVCVQLRHPTLGETSAAMLRALGAGAACVVSDDGPMAELPRDVALRVEIGHREAGGLAAVLRRLRDEPSLSKSLGEAAVQYIRERHNLEDAADRFAASIELGALDREARDAIWLEGASDALASAADPGLATQLIEAWAELRREGQKRAGLCQRPVGSAVRTANP